MKTTLTAILMAAILPTLAHAQDIKLPAPQKTGGKPLMQALAERKSSRQFTSRELDKQTLANLLWAANGFNRADKRTAPSAMNRQEIDLYVFLKTGIYLHDAKANILVKKLDGNHLTSIGTQPFAATAPLGIALVANLADTKPEYANVDAGYISQNIYLYCASENLATVVLGSIDRPALHKLLNLGEKQEALYTQPVGYPPTP